MCIRDRCGARNGERQKEFASIALRLAEEGKIPMSTIDASVERILKYKEMYHVGEMAEKFEDISSELENPSRMAPVSYTHLELWQVMLCIQNMIKNIQQHYQIKLSLAF